MGSDALPQARVLVLTGGPAAGKSTTARALAETLERCVVIDVDDLRHLVVSGHAAPWEGEPGRRQQELGVSHACVLAGSFVREGYAVVIADVLTPTTASLCRRLLDDAVLVQLVLTPGEARRRASQRPVHLTPEEFDALHTAQAAAPPTVDLRLDVTRMSLSQQVEEMRAFWLRASESDDLTETAKTT